MNKPYALLAAAATVLALAGCSTNDGRAESEICTDMQAAFTRDDRTALSDFQDDADLISLLATEASDAGYDDLSGSLAYLSSGIETALDGNGSEQMEDAYMAAYLYCSNA